MKSKVNELVEGVTKIENGTISLTELEITVDVARDLYEKLVIIRHKVYEQSILEKPSYDFSLIKKKGIMNLLKDGETHILDKYGIPWTE